MKLTAEKLRELFVLLGHIPEEPFNEAVKAAREENVPLERLLVDRGLISDQHLGRALADALDYRFVDLSEEKITEDLLKVIPVVVARSQKAIIFERTKGGLKLATSDPENFEFAKLLEKKTGEKVLIYYATPLAIERALKHYKGELGKEIKKLIQDLTTNPEHEEHVIKLVNLLLEFAYDNRASDIHLEPLKPHVSVRFRIDGILHEVLTYSKNLHDKVVSRVKIMAKLRTDEHHAPQDGRLDYKVGRDIFDVRVSVMPVTEGENIVLRLLAERSRKLPLGELGLMGQDLEKVKKATVKPYGMLLAVGPTGCGKTTTLYALLQILNKPEVNIMTIEDPVEYDVAHVQQTQVNPKKGLTFATGLRSIVRQDPDIMMVGEIRDSETADIAINAAMTGHLVLSTLHTSDAATTFPRLVEMGVEPFLIASSVNVVIAQRLVRKICPQCKVSYLLGKKELEVLRAEPILSEHVREIGGKEDFSKIRLYKGAGCRVCGGTGYSGRTGVFEVIDITDELRPLIVQKATRDVVEKKAKELGMTPILYDGITKVFRGITTLEEVIRASKA